MAVIYVPGAFSGTQYAVNIAGDVPTPEEQARIDQHVAQQEAAFQSRYESMFGPSGEEDAAQAEDTTAFGRGVDVGLAGLRRAYGSTLEGIGTVTGLEGVAGYGAGIAEREALELERLAEAAALEKEREAQGAIGSALTYVGEIAGASAPQIAVALAGGFFGGLGGAALASLPYFYGDFREQQKEADIEAGRPVEVSEGAAALAAVPASVLDGVLSAVGAKYGANVLKKAAEGGIFTRAARGAAGGALIEVPTEIGQELLGIIQAGKDPLSDEAIQRYGEAALGAAVLGGGIGAVGGAVITGRKAEEERKKRELDEDIKALGARGDQYIQNARENRATEVAERVASPEAAPLALPAPSTARTTPQEETALRGRAGMEAITPTRPVALTSLPMEERVAISRARTDAGREASPEVTLEELQAVVGTAASEREAKKQKPVTGGVARFGPVENKTFTQEQYDRAVQQVKADKSVSFPKIQKAVRDITKKAVPNTVVRDIRDEMVSRGVIRADTKSRTGYSIEPIARTDSIETSLRREIDGLNKQIDLAQKDRTSLAEEVRRVEQTGKDSSGKRADPALFNQKLDTLDASIEAAKARVAAAETEIKNAKQSGAIPSVERVAMDAAKVAVPMTRATAPAIEQQMDTLRQNIAGYDQQIKDAEKQANNLRKQQKKVQLNNAQKSRLQQLDQTVADLRKLRATATARLRDPSATVQAANEREAASQARFNAATMKEPVNYTPIFTAQQQKVFAALRKRLNNLGLKDVRLEGAQAMLARDQSGKVMGVAEGKYDPVKRIISLSMGIYRKGMTDQQLFDSIASVMNHEVIHALRLMGVLTDAEWRTLTTYAKNKKYVEIKQGKPVERSYTYEERARAMGYDESVVQEEAVAELFRDYLDGKTTVKGPQKTIFERLKSFFKSLIGVHAEQGFDSVEKIFEGIRYGEIGARPRGAATTEAARESVRLGDIGRRERKAVTPVDGEARLSVVSFGKGPAFVSRLGSIGIRSVDDFWTRWRDIMRATAGPDPRLSAVGREGDHFARIDAMLSGLRKDSDTQGLGAALSQFGIPSENGAGPDGLIIARIPREIFRRAGIEPTPENAVLAYEALASADASASSSRRFSMVLASEAARESAIPSQSVIVQRAKDAPMFSDWFGDSKAVDDAGEPRVYYTGTSKDKDFTSFNVGRHGGWFTTNPSEASEYAMQNDSMGYRTEGWNVVKTNVASRVIPAFLRITNPYRGPLPENVIGDNYKKLQSDWFDTLRARGYDGWMPQDAPSIAVVLQEPQQVKSAFASDFDPRKKDMRLSSIPLSDANVSVDDQLSPEELADMNRQLDDLAVAIAADPRERRSFMPVPSPVKNKDGTDSYSYGTIIDYRGRQQSVILPVGEHIFRERGPDTGYGLKHILARKHDQELYEMSKYKDVNKAIFDMLQVWKQQGMRNGDSIIGGKDGDQFALEWIDNRPLKAPRLRLVLSENNRLTPDPFHYVHSFYPSETRVYERGPKPYRRFSMVLASEGAFKTDGVYDSDKIADFNDWAESQAITRITASGDTEDRISTRKPYTKRATEDPLTENLIIDLAAMKQSQQAFAHNMQVIKSYPGFVTTSEDPDQIAEDFIQFVNDNLMWLHNRVPQEIRNRSRLWYNGARKIAERMSGQYQIPDFTVAGVLAALSPQKDWYKNVSLAERLIDIHQTFSRGNMVAFTPTMEMGETAQRIYGKPQYAAALRTVMSNSYAALEDPVLKAMWLRIYDETYNPKAYRTVSAEGDFIGEPSGKIAWGSNSEIAKAIYVLTHQSREATSIAMGDQHKVRNFFNNILAPDAPHGDVTIDTHAVAAALIRPLSGSSAEVLHNFGSSPEKAKQPQGWIAAKSVGDTGAIGVYGIYAEAYRRAAETLGITPRELQSITWEAVRGLFPAEEKKSKAKVARANQIWREVSDGERSVDSARSDVERFMGGINEPTWFRPGGGTSGQIAPSSYEGELAGTRLDRSVSRRASGASGGDAGGVAGIGGGAGAAGRGVRPGQRGVAGGREADRYSAIPGRGVGGRPGTRETEARALEAPEQAVALSPLEPLPGSPRVEGFTGPDPNLVRIADKYAKSIGLDLKRQSEFVDVDLERAVRIAAAYDAMPHAPQDPKVREAYQNLIRQTLAQYNALAQDGYQFWFADPSRPDNEAYLSSPWNALRDIRANKQMGVFPTAGGFGSGATELKVEDNPMLEDTGLLWPVGSPDSEQTAPVLANDLFRAVHDAFGHGLEGSGFRARGEENAWQAHVRLFTGSAVGAITSETRGQNSWLNYGPYGDSNRNAKVEDTVFADQKTGLMPEWTWTEGKAGDMPSQEPTSAPSPAPLARQSMVPTRNSVAGTVQRQTAQKQTNVVYSKAADLLAKGLRITRIGADEARSKQIADGIIKKFQDGMIPVGRMIDELRANGLNVTDAMDTYMQEELYHGVVGEKVEQAQTNLYRPLIDLVGSLKVTDQAKQQLIAASNSASVGRGFADVAFTDTRSNALSMADIFLYARHAKERNEYIRGIDPENDAGSGMTDKEADAILAWFARNPYASTMQKIADAAQRIVQSTNDVRLEGGLIPKEFFQYTDPTTGDTVDVPQYDNYVPLRGKRDPSGEPIDDQATGPYRSPMYGARRREDRRSLGRYDYADNIIPNLLVQNQNAIIRAERNKVGQSFLQLLRSDPAKTKAYGRILTSGDMKDVQTRVLVERKRADGTVSKTVQTVLDPNFRQEPDIFVVKEDGKEVIVKLENDAIASALKGSMSPTHNNMLIRALATINRYLASINTSLNPAFFITNFFRDLQTAGVNVAQYEIDGLTRKVVGDVPGALRGIKQSIRNNDNSSQWAGIYRDFVKNGGQNATNQVNTVADQMNNISGIIGDIADSGARKQFNRVKNGFVGKGAMSLLSFIEDYNTVIENGIRVATYKALLDKGLTPQRAAQAARNITVNFAKGGDYKVFMNSMYLFYNASLQGSFAMLNAALRSRKVQKLWAAAIGVGLMQDYLNAMLSGDDEDGEKLYDKIPEYVLEHNLILPDPFGFTERSYISIPMPYGLNMAHNLGRAMGRLSRGAYDTSEAAGSIVGTVIDVVNPIGGTESFANAAAPTVLDPFIDIWQNENFANQPVYKQGFPGDRTPSSQLYWSTTSVPAVWLASTMNSVTGGTTEVKGLVDVSPDLVDFWFEYLTGGVGRFVIRTAETPFRAYDEGFSEEVIRNVPIFGKIIGTVTTREDTGEYIEKRDRVLTALDEIKAAVEEGNAERIAGARERFSDELKVSGAVRAIDNARTKLARQMRQVRESRLPEEQKRIILERLDERMQQLTARGNQLMRDL